MDVEGNEWSALESMVQDRSLKLVKQLLFEVHTPPNSTVLELRRFSNVIKMVEAAGFRKFCVRVNHYCRYISTGGRKMSECYEFSYLNLNFLKAAHFEQDAELLNALNEDENYDKNFVKCLFC